MKKCCKCELEKSEELFSKCTARNDGLQPMCKPCRSIYIKEYYQNNTNQYRDIKLRKSKQDRDNCYKQIDIIKSKYGCYICQEKCHACLDFHHINANDKQDTISHLVGGKNISKIVAEINKCIVLCSNCHRKIHRNILVLDENVKLCNEQIWSKVTEIESVSE